MNTQVIIDELVKILSDEKRANMYNSDTEMYTLFGWYGGHSPESRRAFVKMFGEKLTELFEVAARKILEEREEQFKSTLYYQHCLDADNLSGCPEEDGYAWCVSSGMKCDGGDGVFGELENLKETDYGRSLCRAERVILVTPEEFERPQLADELVQKLSLKGGCASDDVAEDKKWHELTELEKRTIYIYGAVVTDGQRWYLIDSEGYNYARYIYLPENWEKSFQNICK